MRRTLAALATTLGAALVVAPTASGEVRHADETDRGTVSVPSLECGATASTTAWLRPNASDVSVFKPVEGQALSAYTWGHVSTLTGIETVTGPDGRVGVEFTATGAGAVCGWQTRHMGEDEAATEFRYEINYYYALPANAMTTCRRLKWRGIPRMVSRNGRVRCRTAVALARGWVKASERHTASCRYCILRRAKIRAFACVHREITLVCRRGRHRAVWNVRRPAKPKPPPKPIPGPLGWGEAKSAALKLAKGFPILVEHREIGWCNRWSRWEVHCYVSGWNTTYDYDLDEEFEGDRCSVTAYVTKRSGRRAEARRGGNLSCFYD